NFAPRRPNVIGVRGCHLRVVDDARVGRPEGTHADAVGLDLVEPFRSDSFQPGHAVRHPPPVELLQADHLGPIAPDDDLAAAPELDPFLLAVLVELGRAGDTGLRLERAWRVVNTGVDDTAVVAGL